MRAANQDAIGAARNGELACFVIADGIGGHHGGEVASRIVVDAVLAAFCAEPAFGAPALLAYVGQATAQRGAVPSCADPQLADMSTTVAALLIDQQARARRLGAPGRHPHLPVPRRPPACRHQRP